MDQMGIYPVQERIPLIYQYYLLRDEQRLFGFRDAIRELVTPGSRVLDLGSGTGILSFFAAQQGAYVTAVEVDDFVREASRRFLELNGVGSQVNLVGIDATSETPTGPFDVLICEMMFTGLLQEKQVAVLRRTAQVLGGLPLHTVPRGATLMVDIGTSDLSFGGYLAPFVRPYDPKDYCPLTQTQVYLDVDFLALPESDKVEVEVVLTANRSGEINSLRLSTQTMMIPGITLEASPEYCWPFVFPLDQPINARAGETILIQLAYNFGDHYSRVNVQATHVD